MSNKAASTSGIPAALQEKINQEFVEVTRRIQVALTSIEVNLKLKATQTVLAHLADCSRGTLNNRKWPLERLREIKAARKTRKHPITDESVVTKTLDSRIDRYKEQLYDSREELLIWKARHDETNTRLAAVLNLNRVLQARLEEAEKEILKLRRSSARKVVELAPKLRK